MTGGAMQPETIFFKDVTSGHEVVSLTRELCTDIAHPDLAHPFGTDNLFRDIFSRIIVGSRNSLGVGFGSILDRRGNLRGR